MSFYHLLWVDDELLLWLVLNENNNQFLLTSSFEASSPNSFFIHFFPSKSYGVLLDKDDALCMLTTQHSILHFTASLYEMTSLESIFLCKKFKFIASHARLKFVRCREVAKCLIYYP